MFCSKCGKTIRKDDMICPNCQAPIGDNRFGGIPYTSAQFTIAPGQTDFSARQANSDPANSYTRTTYTSMDENAQDAGEVDTRTTYRPVYEGGSMPESIRKDVRAAMAAEDIPEAEEEPVEEAEAAPVYEPVSPEAYSAGAKETLSSLNDDLQPEEAIDLSQFRSRPIQSAGRAGISRDVSEYIRKLEDDQTRRSTGRHRRSATAAAAAPVYDDYQERTDDNPGGYSEYADEQPYGDDYAQDYEQDGVFDEIDDADFDDMRGYSRFSVGSIIKIVLALVIVAAIVFGAIKWVGYIRGSGSSSPIDGVSEELYEQGLALIKSHTGDEYKNGLITTYTSDGLLHLSTQLDSAKNEIDALMPVEPSANDAIFISALQAIQDNIGSAATMDALSVGKNDAASIEQSTANWQIVNNAILQLEACKTAEELTAVINGQVVTVQTETPQPTQAPVESYTPLQKGDKNDKVLELQERLYKLGYLNDDRDGAFGNNTQTALKIFQEKAGLEASGIADAATQQLLFSDQAPNVNGQTEAGIAAAAATPEPQAEVIQPAEIVETAAQ